MILIPGYSIIEALEENSVVFYKAQRDTDHSNVLIKSISKNDTKHSLQLKHELDIASNLDPSWNLKPIGLEQTDELIAIIYEDFKGQSLSQFLKDKTLEIKEFLKVAISICNNLAKLHEKGIIHKDINPGNILINPDTYETRIVGLGIASLLPLEYCQVMPNPEYIEGTLPFISPEQTGRMNRILDYRTDMYSLGVTFYLMLTGLVPFKTNDPLELVYSHLVRSPENPTEVSPFIPQQISDIVLKLMAKLSEDRYQSMEGLHYDLTKCVSMIVEKGFITAFPLGEKDYSGKFRVSQKIYGRDKEIATLLKCYDNIVNTGIPELVLISGYSGVGKTALVNELNKPIVKEKGFFISGKFDQYKSNIPYSIVQAFKDLVGFVLSLPENKISEWKEKILNAVGINGKIIIDIIPQVELIIGQQPAVADLPPTESKNRFNMVFERFVGIFSSRENPLTIFIDDMQWADRGSLELIKQIMLCDEKRYIMFIGAYRSNELYPTHPLITGIEEIKKTRLAVKNIFLNPLQEEDITKLISDSLMTSIGEVKELSKLVFEKTQGNPFFTIQFLMSLYQEKLLEFDYQQSKWTWKLEDIQKKEYTDNVVDLMVARIRKLKPESQYVLMLASCIGMKFDIKTLSLLTSEESEKVVDMLAESIKEGLIFSYDHVYKFLHDRIREAVYSLIEEKKQSEIHLQLARLLSSGSIKTTEESGLFDIVNQYNLGKNLIVDKAELVLLRDLNLSAGRKAKAATAYASAKSYFILSSQLISENSWINDYQLTFLLYLDLSECEYLLGNFERADQLFKLLLKQAQTKIDKTKVYRLRTILYQIAGRYQDAVDTGLEGLKEFSILFPDSEDKIQTAISEEIKQIPENLRGRTISDLLNTPEATDQNAKSIIGLMAEMASAAYNVRSKYFALIYLRGFNIILKYGNTEDSSYLFAFYALLRMGIFNDIPSAFEYSELSLKLNDKFKNPKLKGRLYNMNAISINYKRRHFNTGLPIFEEGFNSSLEVGDFVYASYISFTIVWHHIETEIPLDEVIKVSNKYIEFNKQNHNTTIYYVIKQYQQYVACLKGLTKGLLSFNDDTFDETKALSIFKNAQYAPGTAVYYILKLITSYTFEQYQEAFEFAILAEERLQDIQYAATEAIHPFFHSLTLSALYPKQSDEKKKEFIEQIKVHRQVLKTWADNCPENFYNRYALVSAELACIQGEEMEAMKWYEQAINSALKNGFLFKAAMAYDLAGKFYKARGFEKISNTYLAEAHSLYIQWGADAKAKMMEENHRFLRKQKITSLSASLGFQIQQLDLLSIIKASQIISGEIELKKLIEKLMNIVIEQAAAEKAFLLLIKEEQLWLVSQAEITEKTIEITIHLEEATINPDNLPESVVQYVKRIKEKTILNDASTPNLFSTDKYILANRPKSIACLPIIKQGKLFGILYLENNLFTSAFSPDKVLILETLASQAAISIENAMLFTELANSRQILQDTMNNSSAAIFIRDLQGKYIFVNKVYQETFDIPEIEIIGKTTYDIWPKEIADRLTAHDKEVLHAGKPITFEEIGLPIHETKQTKISVRFPVFDFNGKIYAIGGISTDITARKSAEEALRERESRIRRLVDSNIIGIFFWDEGGVITEANDAFAQLLGYTTEELINIKLHWQNLSTNPFSGSIKKASNELETDGSCIPTETEFIKKDHTHIPVLLAGTLLEKGIDKGIGFVLNLTDLKKAEDEIRRLNLGLQHQIKELTYSKEELQKLNLDLLKTNTDLDTFIYAASHNVRGPASSLEGLINLLELKLYEPDELESIVKMMKRLMSKFNQTINDLTELSKVQRIMETKDITDNNIDKVIEEIKDEVKIPIESSEATIKTDLDAAPTIVFSHNNFKRILYNLIINAITYSSPLRKPEIVITSSETKEYVILTVSDNGLGIHKQYIDKIFEMFKRAHDHVQGRGIGLYIVRRIIENSNGKIEVESELNKGTTFRLYFRK